MEQSWHCTSGTRAIGEAIVSYDKAIALKPNFPEALCNRGGVLKKMKRLTRLLPVLTRQLHLNGTYPKLGIAAAPVFKH